MMKKKGAAAAGGGGGMAAELISYQKQIAELKAESKTRFAKMKLQLDAAIQMKSEYEAKASAAGEKKAKLQHSVSSLEYSLKTLRAEMAAMRAKLAAPNPRLAAMEEEAQAFKAKYAMAMQQMRAQQSAVYLSGGYMEAKWAKMHKKHIEEQHQTHEGNMAALKQQFGFVADSLSTNTGISLTSS